MTELPASSELDETPAPSVALPRAVEPWSSVSENFPYRAYRVPMGMVSGAP